MNALFSSYLSECLAELVEGSVFCFVAVGSQSSSYSQSPARNAKAQSGYDIPYRQIILDPP